MTKTYSVTITYSDNGTRCVNDTHEALGDAYGVRYATIEAAQAVAADLQADADDLFPGSEVQYEVEAHDEPDTIVPPACHGQAVEYSYTQIDGVCYRRRWDRSDNTVGWASAQADDEDDGDYQNVEPDYLLWDACAAPTV